MLDLKRITIIGTKNIISVFIFPWGEIDWFGAFALGLGVWNFGGKFKP
jgi:hypothetical protein